MTTYPQADAAAVTSPDDYVIATGEMHSVREFLQEVFSYLELDWKPKVTFSELAHLMVDADLKEFTSPRDQVHHEA